MALKSLAEIAFDAFQCFVADRAIYFNEWRWRNTRPFRWEELTPNEKNVWERIAGRVEAEIASRTVDGEYTAPRVEQAEVGVTNTYELEHFRKGQ